MGNSHSARTDLVLGLTRVRRVLERVVDELLNGEVAAAAASGASRPMQLYLVQAAASQAAAVVSGATQSEVTSLLLDLERLRRRHPRHTELQALLTDAGRFAVTAATYGVLHVVTTFWTEICDRASEFSDAQRDAVFACLYGIAFQATTAASATVNQQYADWNADERARRHVPNFAQLMDLGGAYGALLRGDGPDLCRIVRADARTLAALFEEFRQRTADAQQEAASVIARLARTPGQGIGRYRPY